MLPQILVVDDEEPLLDMMAMALEMMGYQATRASSLSEASRLTQAQRFDLVLLDNHFPEGHGDSIVPALLERWPELRIVIVTANDTDQHVTRAISLGAREILNKPFGLDELGSVVARHCGATQAGAHAA
jgi:two-component system nitrogen regulation response regulator GlnG